MTVPDELTPLAEGRLHFGDLAVLLALTGGLFAWQGVPISMGVIVQHKVQTASSSGFDPMGVIVQHKAQTASSRFDGADISKAESLFFVGWGIGAVLTMLCVDRFGRKLPCLGLLTLGLVSAAASTAAHTPFLYALAMVFVGLSCNASIVASLLLMESVPERLRNMVMALLNACMSGTNLAVAVVGASLTRELPWQSEMLMWEVPFVVLLPAALALLREPPQLKEARAEADSESGSAAATPGPLALLFGSPELRGHLAANMITWTAINLGIYSLSYSSGTLSSSLYRNLALYAAVDTLCFGLAGPVVELLGGARTAQMASFLGAAAAMVVCSVLPAGNHRVASALVGRFFLDVVGTTVSVLPVGCFPVGCRGTAFGALTSISNVVTLAAPLFALIEVHTVVLIICAFCVSAALATWTLPEEGTPAGPASELLEHGSERKV